MNIDDIFSKINSHTIILTPNRRLASYFQDTYNQYQSHLGLHAWPTIACLPFNAWVLKLWYESYQQDLGLTVISPLQETLIWQQLIKAHTHGVELLRVSSTAKQAIEAWNLIHNWQLAMNVADFEAHPDCAQFFEWCQHYLRYTESNKLIDSVMVIKRLIAAIKNKTLQLQKNILLSGFDECSPLQMELLQCLADSGCTIEFCDLDTESQSFQTAIFDTPDEELHALAAWAKALHAQQPTLSIGCVIPNLTEIRTRVETIFIKTFAGESFLDLSRTQHLPINISSGCGLNQYPLVYAALTLLEINPASNRFSLCQLLLETPFIKGYFQERSSRASLTTTLSKLGLLTLSLTQFLMLIQNQCPQLSKVLYQYQKLVLPPVSHPERSEGSQLNNQRAFVAKNAPQNDTAEKCLLMSEWAGHFTLILKTLGWPGDRELDSVDYQFYTRFQELFTEFAQLDLIFPACDYQTALTHLKLMAAETVFQAQSGSKPIQVLGALEAAGMQFDALWMTHVVDSQFPTAAKPNPFIPMSIQHKKQLPHATAARELQFAKHLINRFVKSARAITFSHALEDNNRILSPSPLFPNKSASNTVQAQTSTMEHIILHARDFEIIDDSEHLEISFEALQNIRGGVSIFKDQAACSFRAFARFRLHALSMDNAHIGLSPPERGALIHAVLEGFWKQVQSQQQLKALSTEALNKLIAACIEQAFQSTQLERLRQQPHFFDVEKQRLEQLMSQWLDIEKARPPFTVVATEQKGYVEFEKMPLQIRIDRIDQLSNGDYVIIDYKTGLTTIDGWFGDRPDEPQLPLYCMTHQDNIGGLLFAQLKLNALGYKGVTANPSEIKGIKTIQEITAKTSMINWSQQKSQWQLALQQLAQEFLAGTTRIDPKYGAKTCDFCDLKSLCRIQYALGEDDANT